MLDDFIMNFSYEELEDLYYAQEDYEYELMEEEKYGKDSF